MRVRRLGLRLIGLGLVGAWGLAAALILSAYRPGGPLDLIVGITMVVPVGIALASVVWPPLTRRHVTHAAMVALGLATLLVLLPSIGGVWNQLQALGSQTLLPSLEAAYPWLLALLGTSLYTGFGQARRMIGGTAGRSRRTRIGIAIAAALTLLAGTAFGAAAIANELALRDTQGQPVASRFGPTQLGPDTEPPACDGPLDAGPTSRLTAHFSGQIDGRPIGTVDLSGQRAGTDFRWLAYVATNRELGQHGMARRGDVAWVRTPTRGWERAMLDSVTDETLDLQAVRDALNPGARAAAEDRGIEVIERAPARRCRVSVDGPIFRASFPQVAWLIGDDDLGHWRGQLDYWVFLDGTVGQIAGSVNGEAGNIEEEAIQGRLDIFLTATYRGSDIVIRAPAP
ncbi:MAG TPA: hypothetical protein VFM38_08165 [Candidatus Limnocylindrales bacterium]|nr:hypothetical protein [Candidatus Limnocylindrales bacterium]